MELKSKFEYRNAKFTLPAGSTTIGRIDINDEDKKYLIETFPEEFTETTVEEEEALAAEAVRISEIIQANKDAEENPHNPFDADPMTSKVVEIVEEQESKIKITANDTKPTKNNKKK